jgi:hypothetical protein
MTPHTGIRAASDRAFGLAMSGVFAALALWPLARGEPVRGWTAGVAAGFLIVALARAPLLAPLNRAWTGLAAALHRVMSPVAMAVLFFGVLTPLAWILRRCGRDALRLRPDPKAATYWIARGRGAEPGGMRHPY